MIKAKRTEKADKLIKSQYLFTASLLPWLRPHNIKFIIIKFISALRQNSLSKVKLELAYVTLLNLSFSVKCILVFFF